MYGAIYGDMIGSRFEFDKGGLTKEFELFTPESRFTDDTVMSIAVCDALLQSGPDAAIAEIKENCVKSMQYWGNKYPNAGYGGRFRHWLSQDHPKPYGSWGNGSAMRVSAVGWLYDSMERTREVAAATAAVTHNHPEGIKGAECTAAVIFLGKTNASKDEIKEYVVREFGYDLTESLEQMRARHRMDVSCQDTLPKALVSFLEGESYEDVVRNAVSLGGDTDTIAAIAGAMAESFYRIPIGIMAKGNEYLDPEMFAILEAFDQALGRGATDEGGAEYADNIHLKHAVQECIADRNEQTIFWVLEVLAKLMLTGGQAPTPMVDVNHVWDRVSLDQLTVGESISLEEEMRLQMDTMQDGAGNLWFPLFTDMEELHKGDTTNININMMISDIIDNGINSDRVQGIVINPFEEGFVIPKNILEIVVKLYERLKTEEV